MKVQIRNLDHPELPLRFHFEYHRHWFRWRTVNLCFYDGVVWHQANEEVMDDNAKTLEWVKDMHWQAA